MTDDAKDKAGKATTTATDDAKDKATKAKAGSMVLVSDVRHDGTLYPAGSPVPAAIAAPLAEANPRLLPSNPQTARALAEARRLREDAQRQRQGAHTGPELADEQAEQAFRDHLKDRRVL